MLSGTACLYAVNYKTGGAANYTAAMVIIGAAVCAVLGMFYAKNGKAVFAAALVVAVGYVAGFFLYAMQLSAYSRAYKSMESRAVLKSAISDIKYGEYGIEFTAVCRRYARVRLRCDYKLFDKDLPEDGAVYEFEAEYEDFETAANYGNFDEKAYYNSLGYAAAGVVKNIKKIKDAGVLRRSINDIRENIRENISKIYPEDSAGLAGSIIIGDKSGLTGELKELFGRNGVGHILAISSLHLTYVGMAFYGLLKRRLHYIPASFICMAVMAVYAVLTGLSVSAVRAVIMLCVRLAADIAGRKYDASCSLSLWVIIALAGNPAYIYNSSFILSGSVSFFIISVIPKMKKIWFSGGRGHVSGKNLAKQILAKQILAKQISAGKSLAMKSLFESAALYMLSMPVTALLFYRIPIYSVFLNLIVIPLLSYVLVSGILGVILCDVHRMAGVFAAGSGNIILKFYRRICEFADNLPAGSITVGKPGISKIIIFYAAVLIILFISNIIAGYEKKHNAGFFSVIKRIVILSGVVILFQIMAFEKRDGIFISFINVGQGDSIFIKAESGTSYLVDAGSSSIKNVGKNRISTHLYACGRDTVDYAVISHADGDHVSGILEFLDNPKLISIKNIILPDIPEKNENYEEIEKKAKERGIKIIYMTGGDMIKDGEMRFVCINPGRDDEGDINDKSLVLSVKYKSFSMLLTGDITEKTEKKLMDKRIFDREDFPDSYTILKVAHHGSKYSSSSDFIKKVNPMYSVISYGRNNYGHPSDEAIGRLNAQSSKVMSCAGGGIMMRSMGDGVHILRGFSESIGNVSGKH